MKNQLITFTLVLLCSFQSVAQSSNYTIQIKKTTFGASFLQNEKRLTPKQLLDITEYKPEANELMKKAKKNADVSMVLGAIGSFMVGWSIGGAIAGVEPNWTFTGVGAGLLLAAIPFSVKYSKQAKEAVSIHNETAQNVSGLNLKLGLFSNGLSLRISL